MRLRATHLYEMRINFPNTSSLGCKIVYISIMSQRDRMKERSEDEVRGKTRTDLIKKSHKASSHPHPDSL